MVEETLHAIDIGSRIRLLRLKRSMGLLEFSKQSGLSASLLSQLETGKVFPTIRNLSRISIVFKKYLSYFFRKPNALAFRRSREKDRIRLSLGIRDQPFWSSESLSGLTSFGNRMHVPFAGLAKRIGSVCH
jgi:transcriptional regulator with XRE-family HTH domain